MHNGSVRVRTGTVLAFCLGYLLGTRAGRERYRQIMGALSQVGRSAPVSGTASLVGAKSRAVANLGVERLKDTVGVRLGWRNGDQAADAIAVDLAEDLASRAQPPPAATGAAARALRTLAPAPGGVGPQSGLVEVVPQELCRLGSAQLRQRLGLDLPDPLAGHPEGFAHLFERPDLAVLQAEAESHHVLLAR